jgi:hypothetical protein
VVGGMHQLILLVYTMKMTIDWNKLEHGVLHRTTTERNIYRLILAAKKQLQLWLHKEEMCILNMSKPTGYHFVVGHHGSNIVKEDLEIRK